jgi:hypothetical protein
MFRDCCLMLLVSVLLAGCSATKQSLQCTVPLPTQLFPADALVTQRGVLTVRGRQFSVNGYVAKSRTHGLRLIMTENFGAVLADVLVNPGGKLFVMRAKPPFRRAWVERYIAADLMCIFGEATDSDCPVRIVSPTHFTVDRRWYKLDLWTVETKPGVQPAEMFDVTKGGKP